VADSRLTGEMHVPDADHDRHDELLIAGLLDRSTGGAERDRAEVLIATCEVCAALHRDLISLRDAARALPTPLRPRDYTITSGDAARLRRTGWRRLVAVFGSTRDAFSRPLAIGLTTIGLAGILVATIPGALSLGGSSAASVPTVGQSAGGAGANAESLEGSKALAPAAGPSEAPPAGAALIAPSAAPTAAPEPVAASAEPARSADSLDTFVGTPVASSGAAAIAPEAKDTPQRDGTQARSSAIDAQAAVPTDRSGVIVLAGLLLAAGLALFALRWAARRI
jgi:hypothetical protein